MLSDRPYMRGSNRSGDTGRNALLMLIVINVVIWLWTGLIANNRSFLVNIGVLSVPYIKDHYQMWRLFSYMFLHANFFHLLFNMWTLYIFGESVAEELGRNKFLMLYFISGIFGGALWMAANWANPESIVEISGMLVRQPKVVLGASGAVSGVMLAMAMLNPNREYLLLFFPFPIKCRTLVIVFAIAEVIFHYKGGDGVAHLAHLGGFVAAYFYLRFACARLLLWDPLAFLLGKPKPRTNGTWTVHDSRYGAGPKSKPSGGGYKTKTFDAENYRSSSGDAVSPREIDRLLDKISSGGINSLTPDELKMLRQARKQMKRN